MVSSLFFGREFKKNAVSYFAIVYDCLKGLHGFIQMGYYSVAGTWKLFNSVIIQFFILKFLKI